MRLARSGSTVRISIVVMTMRFQGMMKREICLGSLVFREQTIDKI